MRGAGRGIVDKKGGLAVPGGLCGNEGARFAGRAVPPDGSPLAVETRPPGMLQILLKIAVYQNVLIEFEGIGSLERIGGGVNGKNDQAEAEKTDDTAQLVHGLSTEAYDSIEFRWPENRRSLTSSP